MDIFAEIASALRSREALATATIISSSGSTPVPPGSKILMKGGGTIPIGTVGGGCIEADILEAARLLRASGRAFLIRRFTLTEDDIESGMLCGGSLDVLIEQIEAKDAPIYETVLSNREIGRDSVLVTLVESAASRTGKYLVAAADESAGIVESDLQDLRRAAGELPDGFAKSLREAVEREVVSRHRISSGGELIVEPVVGLQDLVIFGGGHVSRFVCRGAAMAGYRVTVVDDRVEYANPQRFPEAHRTLAVWFDEAWEQLRITPSASIVIVTRGHKSDELVLGRAVMTEARYIGMIGSKRKVLTTFSNLVNRGTPPDRLRSVHAPIGLDIGAQTAEEIGVSIVAELIAVRRGVTATASKSNGVTGALNIVSENPR